MCVIVCCQICTCCQNVVMHYPWLSPFIRYTEFSEKVMEGGGERAIARHTQRNRKLLVRDRLRLLLDDEDFLELSAFAGLGLPYGDIPSAGTMTGQKRLQISVTAAKYPHLISLFQIIFCLLHIFWDLSVTLYAFFCVSVQTSFRHRQDQWPVVCVCRQ